MEMTLSSFPIGLLRTMARGAERPSDRCNLWSRFGRRTKGYPEFLSTSLTGPKGLEIW